MERRSDLLIQELEGLLGTDEVYFQPDADVSLSFPCFIVRRTTAYQPSANDNNYLFRPGYEVTYINRDEPDPEMIETIIRYFQVCSYQRHFVVDNLHHDVFTIYY